MNELTSKTGKALGWSSVTEVLTKIISPVVNMILARLLAPHAFGMLATVAMVVSFAQIFVASVFEKYLIQHDFDTSTQEAQHMSVAFWTNLCLSGVLWGVLALFQNPLATLAGNPTLGLPVALSGVTLPLYAAVGVQSCHLKKNLDFKKLFYVRVVSSLTPLVVTLPMALCGLGYWSLIWGNVAGVVVQFVLLCVLSPFRPMAYYSFADLGYMLRYGVWTLLDGLVTWISAWVDAWLISHLMNEYYLGLYKNATSTILTLFGVVTASLTPGLFASLSRLQNDREGFSEMLLKSQKWVAMLLLPMGVGVYFYADIVTMILFGEAWQEAADIIGIMGLTTALRTVFVSLYGDAYRAKGKFFLPLLMQLLDLAILIPVCVMSIRQGFWQLTYARAFVRLDLIIPEMIALFFVCGISPVRTGKNILPSAVATVVMTGGIYLLQKVSLGVVWSVVSIILCILLYACVLLCFPKEREMLLPMLKNKQDKEKGGFDHVDTQP